MVLPKTVRIQQLNPDGSPKGSILKIPESIIDWPIYTGPGFPASRFAYLDGGQLDIGIIRDTALNIKFDNTHPLWRDLMESMSKPLYNKAGDLMSADFKNGDPVLTDDGHIATVVMVHLHDPGMPHKFTVELPTGKKAEYNSDQLLGIGDRPKAPVGATDPIPVPVRPAAKRYVSASKSANLSEAYATRHREGLPPKVADVKGMISEIDYLHELLRKNRINVWADDIYVGMVKQ